MPRNCRVTFDLEREGLPSAIPGWGLQSNECPLAIASSHFCFPHPLRASSRVCSKQKCPGKAGGIHLIGGEGGTSFEPFCERFNKNLRVYNEIWLPGAQNYKNQD